jgi:hypothetical protein
MKRLIASALAAIVALSLAACGSQEQPQKEDPKPEANTVKIIQTEDGAKGIDSKSGEQAKQGEEEPAKEQPTEEKPAMEDVPEGEQKITVFKGQFASCQLPEKWSSQEDISQGVAAALLDPSTRAGVVVQFRQDAKEPLGEIVDGINAQLKGKVDSVTIGKYQFSRITTTIDGKTVIYLITLVGTNAYYVSTDIFDHADVQLVLRTLELK